MCHAEIGTQGNGQLEFGCGSFQVLRSDEQSLASQEGNVIYAEDMTPSCGVPCVLLSYVPLCLGATDGRFSSPDTIIIRDGAHVQ